LVSLTAHEIGHQWWFGAVGNDQVHEPWLDEPLATYGELLFYETFYPTYAAWWWDSHIGQWTPAGPVDRSIHDFGGTWPYVRDIYGRSQVPERRTFRPRRQSLFHISEILSATE